MKKQLFHFCIMAMMAAGSITAHPPGTSWIKTYGGLERDQCFSVQQTYDGGFIMTGETYSFGMADNCNVYLVRTDSNGDTLWTKTYGGKDVDVGNSVAQTSDSGFVIAGLTLSFGNGDFDIYLIRTDAYGDTLWTKTFGSISIETAYSVQQTSDGGFIITGELRSWGAGWADVWLIRTDANGNELWNNFFGSTYNDYGYSVQQTSDGGFIIAGEYDDNAYLLRTDSKGKKIWSKTFGNVEARSVLQTSDGGFVAAGIADSAGKQDVYLIRTDENGDTVWIKTYGGPQSDGGYSVLQTSDGNLVIAGCTYSFGEGGSDVYLICTNAMGDTLWTRTYGGTKSDKSYSVQQISDGGFIVAGMTNSFGEGNYDFYLIRTDKNGNVPIKNQVPVYSTNHPCITTFSDYTHNHIVITYQVPQYSRIKLEVYTLKGRRIATLVDNTLHSGTHTVNWNAGATGAAPGLYFIRLAVDGTVITQKFVKRR